MARAMPSNRAPRVACGTSSISPSTARNYAAIGSHRHSKDGYLERTVTDDQTLAPARRWVAVHRLVWEAEHGPIPAGHAVVFLPGRRTRALKKITIDALELVSRAELMRRNSSQRYGTEIQQTMSALGRLKKAIDRKGEVSSKTKCRI